MARSGQFELGPRGSPGLCSGRLAGAAGVVALAALGAAAGSAREPAWLVVVGGISLALAGVAGVRWYGRRQALRLRRAFAAGISHELRTPLAQIQMFTEMLLLRRDRSVEERMQWLQVIEREAHALDDLIENLLLLHGSDSAPPPARRPTDLGALLEDIAACFASRAAARQMRVEADPPEGIIAVVDARAVRQVIVNLLDNSLRYGPPGQVVSLSLRAHADFAELAVTNRGPGIEALARERATAETSFPSSGSGLGLAVVGKVVRAHGGRVLVDEAPGGGARFRVFLPVSAAVPA